MRPPKPIIAAVIRSVSPLARSPGVRYSSGMKSLGENGLRRFFRSRYTFAIVAATMAICHA